MHGRDACMVRGVCCKPELWCKLELWLRSCLRVCTRTLAYS